MYYTIKPEILQVKIRITFRLYANLCLDDVSLRPIKDRNDEVYTDMVRRSARANNNFCVKGGIS